MKPEYIPPDEKAVVRKDNNAVPDKLRILPLKNQVAFPTLNMSLALPLSASTLVEDAMKSDRIVGIVGIKDSSDEPPLPGQVYETGTAVRILYVTRAPDNTVLLVVHGLKRFRISEWIPSDDYLRAKIEMAPETSEDDIEVAALHRNLRDLTQEIFSLSLTVPDEAIDGLQRVENTLHLAYIAAAYTEIEYSKRQSLLEEDSLKAKLKELIRLLIHEREVLTLGKKIQSEARQEMNKSQRDYFLRQQLKAIKKELGETDETKSEPEDYSQRIAESDMSDEARREARRELQRLEEMSPQSAEYSMVKTYLDWLLDLPWNQLSEDQSDIQVARNVLNEDHYGLGEVKDRIIEYMAVKNLLEIRDVNRNSEKGSGKSSAAGAILCFAGPPGVGKTSLGKSIARAMGREFTRMSLGGVRDEAEIRGHRRTYIGALPGRIIQAIKRAGTRNPVYMLDEVDKIGADWRGDPSSALLEVLDPAQNFAFRDHYLDVDFDLSDVVFIATANQLDTIPAPLRDRMEIIELDGYTETEKLHIAKRHLIPRQLDNHALNDSDVTFMDEAVRKIIGDYTREAGVRQLERFLGAICRKSIVKLTTGTWEHVMVTPELVSEHLKKERFESDNSEKIDVPGISTGLAVTSVGGDILFVEATRMNGSGRLNLTGQLGDVMKESASIAYSYLRSNVTRFGIEAEQFSNFDVHLHVPAGAIPKDGPSAGVAMVVALASLYSNRLVCGDIGMTGEVTLRGRILPVGGIKMKVLAAHRAGLNKVIIPKRNEKDLDDIPLEVRDNLDIVLIERIEDAIDIALNPFISGNELSNRESENYINHSGIHFLPITASRI